MKDNVLCSYELIMSELMEFQPGQIVRTHMVDASVSKVAEVLYHKA